MPVKKFIVITVLTFALATQVSVVAFAGDDKDYRGHRGGRSQVAVPPMVITPYSDDDGKYGEDDDYEDDDEYGDDGEDDAPAFNIKTSQQSFKVSPPIGSNPPSVIVPDVTGNQSVVESNITTVNPNANAPIEMKGGLITKKTPADVFVESAQVGLGAMAAGAALLGVTAAVRGVRFRRQVKTDFIYEVED